MSVKQSIYRVGAAAVSLCLVSCTGFITSGGDDDGDGGGDGGDGDGGNGGDGGVDEGPYTGELGTILFATQVPVGGIGTRMAPFSNHLATIDAVPRGGDLMIRYPDGTLRNLTREAGFGDEAERQGANAIAVREPTVHWSGNRAVFSMVVGAVTERYDQDNDFRWQIYEVTGLARDEDVAIRRIEGQPADYNNVSPAYGSDDQILFVSDRPRGGEAHLYPQLDEYESMPSTVGIYRLDEEAGSLELVEHAPSGVFSLTVDTFGRVIFTKWDHLQRDQQADNQDLADRYGVLTYADESSGAAGDATLDGSEMFPEARDEDAVGADPAISGHRFNQFFAWEMNQDGSGEETLNHVGRQEWGGSYSEGSFVADDNLDYEAQDVFRGTNVSLRSDGGVFHIRQDATDPAWYLATEAAEFGGGGGGDLVRLQGDPAVNPEDMDVQRLTPDQTGLYRSPLRLSDGTYVAVHSPGGGDEGGLNYRLTVLAADGERFGASQRVTGGIERTVSWFTPDRVAEFSGQLWEIDPVEVAPRETPPPRSKPLPAVEQAVFDDVGVQVDALSTWLRERELALVVSRNVTQRDRNDVQQPYNLRVPGGVSSAPRDGTVYDVSHIQFVQGDLIRAYESGNRGRRVLARPMHGADLVVDAEAPAAGSVAIGADGSMAAFVPARRAMSWQLVDPEGNAVVRERNWVSFRAGEIRVCTACHGINKESQTGDPEPENQPEALRALLTDWLATQ